MSIDVGQWRGMATDENSERSTAEGPGVQATVRLRAASRRLLASLLRPHRRAITAIVALLLVQNAAVMMGPYLVKVGIDRGIPPLVDAGDADVLMVISVAFVLTTLAEYLGKRGFLALSGRVGQAILLNLRQRVYNHFQRLSVGFHERYTSGRMVARLSSDLDSIAELVDGGVGALVMAGLSVISIAVVLLVLDPPLALVTLLSFPVLLWLSNWFRHASARAYRRTREAVALMIVHFVESLGGIRAVQGFRREPRNQEIFEMVNGEYQAANLAAFRLVAKFSPGIKVIGNVTIAVVLTYGGYRVLHGQAEVGVLAAFLLYLRRFFEPMQELSQFYNSLQSATAALEKLSGVLQEQPDVPEPAAPRLHAVALRQRTAAPRPYAVAVDRGPGVVRTGPGAGLDEPARIGAVTFTGVSFGYRQDTVVLPPCDLHIPAGQTVALVGATGAGKSTVAKLVARFYDPCTGSVTLDGVDLRELAEAELRRTVVMVTQENYLFSGTIAHNIEFGRPGASQAEVEAAAVAIGAHGFIRALPDGYHTNVRKRGGRLSAGQRQLIAFARAFLADPGVLILDEATSSLDIPSERLVQRALRTILAERTALVIAHRLSTVEIADRVLVVEGGRIVEDGSPTELVASDGHYAALHRQWRDSLGEPGLAPASGATEVVGTMA